MKQLLLLTALISSTTFAWAQNSSRLGAPVSEPGPKDPWDLNNYVWSHTHPTPSPKDKPILDFDAIENVTSLGEDLTISPDGKYFAYSIHHAKRGMQDILVVQATTGPWRQTFTGASPGFFSGNSQQYIFQDKDNLCFVKAGSGQPPTLQEIASYKSPQDDKGQWLAYQLKNKEATLVVQDLLTGTQKRFGGVADYAFYKNGQWLAYHLSNEAKELVIYHLATQKQYRFSSVADYLFNASGQAMVLKINNTATQTSLQHVSLPEGTMQTIWQKTDSNTQVSSYSIDGTGKQVVFALQETFSQPGLPRQSNSSIWYWRTGMDKALLKVNNQTEGIEAGMLIQGGGTFTEDDRYVLFTLQPKEPDLRKPNPDAVKVDVWSYKDTILQSTQPYMLKMPKKTYSALISTAGNRVIRLEKEYENLKSLQGDFSVIVKSIRDIQGDRFWEKDYQKDSIWILSLQNGSRRLIGNLVRQNYAAWFSPGGGNYVIYFDVEKGCNYFSIDLSSGKLTNISAAVPAWQLGEEDRYLRPHQKPGYGFELAGWLEKEGGLLVYDNYDIWQLDLAGKKTPVNITNGYGRKNRIKLRLADIGIPRDLPLNASLLLKAFNTNNKQEGFYHKVLGTAGNPELRYMGPCKLDLITSTGNSNKITDTGIWILRRQTATQAPNYFKTADFKNYQPLTDLQPHKGYNWLTAELHSFKQMDGTLSQGVLYKPENFDPAKKYPVIIAFYGTLSDLVYTYPSPELIWAPSAPAWNPGWMASHGYLVFTPDIYFTKGQWGPSALNTVEGAARYLSSLPFVDGKHLGACGHSNSGRLGYYVLTHSKSFAAMSVGAGTTDVISMALSLTKSGQEASNLEWAEIAAYGGGLGNLWLNKASWLDHTAVLHADNIYSPLLLFHNKKDGVPIEQAVAIFTALRRLEKKAWWLQYNDQFHTVGGKDAKDFTIRYTQYFDHYLKGAPPPYWMTTGIPAKYKQIESRYDLDIEGSCGINCAICNPHKIANPSKSSRK